MDAGKKYTKRKAFKTPECVIAGIDERFGALMVNINKYDFSFTTMSLGVNEMIQVAEAVRNGEPMNPVCIGSGNSKTGKKKLSEIQKRIKKLTSKQLNLLIGGDLITQRQIAFLSICKTHLFIRDFTVEILREKLLIYDYQITKGDYIGFFRRKAEVYPEMDNLTELTRDKIRQVTFKILEQAGIIDHVKTKVIQPQLLQSQVIDTIVDEDQEWLKVFLMSDIDIENQTKKCKI